MSLEKINFGNRFSTNQIDALQALAKDVNPIVDAVIDLQNNSYTLPYLVYTALLSQSGTDAPTAVELDNTIGDIVWTYSSTGNYIATLAGAFPSGQVFAPGVSVGNAKASFDLGFMDGDTLILSSYNQAGAAANNILNSTSIEIRVYN